MQYRIFLCALIMSNVTAQTHEDFNPTTTNPYDVGIPYGEISPYGSDGQEEQERLTRKYTDISNFSREELAAYTHNKIFGRTHKKRVKNALADLSENVQFGSLPYALLALGGTGLLHFARLKAFDNMPIAKHRGTILLAGLSLLGGTTASYLFSQIKKYILKQAQEIIVLLQLDNATLYRLVRNRQKSLSLIAIGLPNPFTDDGSRIRLPKNVCQAIETFEKTFSPQSFSSDEEGGKKLREIILPLLKGHMKKLDTLHKTLFPAAIAAWTLFGANMWAYPGTLVGRELAGRISDNEEPTDDS